MPYLNRRTVRSLLSRSRPSHSPALSSATSKTATPAPEVQDAARSAEDAPGLPPSASAPAALTDGTNCSTPAVTANEGSVSASPATVASAVAASASAASPCTLPDATPASLPEQPNTTSTAQADTRLPESMPRTVAKYMDAGIPLFNSAEPLAASQPGTDQAQTAPDSPPFRFDGIFAVPAVPVTAAQPVTPGAPPPLYQQHASESEVFPQMPFTPFHLNNITPRDVSVEHELPGDDRFPRYAGSRVVDGSWLGGRFERFTVGGRTFFCPVHLMLRYPHWRLLLSLERPPHGWVLSSAIDASIFALVIEALISPSGFDGTEPGLNLVSLALACRQALDWGMDREVAKLAASFRRYVARRVFYRNPHRPDTHGVMDHNYFVRRSEEIFRAWRVLSRGPRSLQRCIAPGEMACLYALAVPRDLWPALTADFPDEFAGLVDLSSRIRAVPEAVDYHDWWLRFFRLAGCLDYDWIADVPGVLNMFFESQEGRREENGEARDGEGVDTDELHGEGVAVSVEGEGQ